MIKGLITLCVVSLAFLIFFFLRIQNASENQSENTRTFSILHHALGKNASQLRFLHVFPHKPYQNAPNA